MEMLIESTDLKSEKAINLSELKPLKFIIYSILISLGVFITEIGSDLMLGKALEELPYSQLIIVSCLLYFSLSILIAGSIYKIRKAWLMLTVSFIVMVLVRLLIVTIYFDMTLTEYVYITLVTSGITLIMFLVAFGFISIFRVTAKVFKFAKLKNIQNGIVDIATETEYDTGVCCNCGFTTKIAKENSFLPFLPKKNFHFCDRCGVFLRDNPLVSIFFGFSEIILSSFLFVGLAVSMDTANQSSIQSITFLFVLCGVLDGLRRGYSGLKGLMKSRKHK